MATLSKHPGAAGRELEFVTFKRAYADDGWTLVNRGDGWKRYKKMPAPLVDEQYEIHRSARERRGTQQALDDLARIVGKGLGARRLFNALYSLFGSEELDGAWAACQDDFMFAEFKGMSVADIQEGFKVIEEHIDRCDAVAREGEAMRPGLNWHQALTGGDSRQGYR